MIALIFAIAAIVANVSPAYVSAFTEDMLDSGYAVDEPGTFVGWEWTCDDSDAESEDPESCYAGLLWIVSDDGQSRVASLETGP